MLIGCRVLIVVCPRFPGVGNVIWTSPINGIVDVTGNAWMTRDIGRSNQWILKLNGITLSSGNISSGDPYSRANPFEFINGSGGPSALAGIPVSVGDVFRLDIVKTSGPGDSARGSDAPMGAEFPVLYTAKSRRHHAQFTPTSVMGSSSVKICVN